MQGMTRNNGQKECSKNGEKKKRELTGALYPIKIWYEKTIADGQLLLAIARFLFAYRGIKNIRSVESGRQSMKRRGAL